MKNVLLLANFMDINENTNNRFNYLAKMLKDECNLQVVTSTFSHREKKQRKNSIKEYKINMLYEPSYKKNISLKRFYSHYVLSKNLKKYLNNLEKKPDVIYCAVPALDFAKEAAKYAKKNKIRFIVDIQDLWPEAFKMIFNVPIISNIIFYPMVKKANYIYKQADDIVAVSETYANRAMEINSKSKNKTVTFLGTDLEYFDRCKKDNNIIKNDERIKIVYIGTLGHSYDIKIIIDSLKKLQEKYDNLEFIIIGDGPLRKKFEKYAFESQITYKFTGRLDYDKMVGILCNCDIAVNPISHGAAQSIINKVGDYAAAGLPIINTQENEEYRSLVRNYKIGYNCKNNDEEDITNKIKALIENSEERKQFGLNNRKLAEEKFNRKNTYKQIIKLIQE